jgi:hypothetical protein
MASERYSVERFPVKAKASAMRVVGIEVMLSGALMFIIGGSMLAVIYFDTQPGYVFILPGALLVAGAFYTLRGLYFLTSR